MIDVWFMVDDSLKEIKKHILKTFPLIENSNAVVI